jgi:SAM-dependent methyltransferase
MSSAAPAAAHLDGYRGTWQDKAVLRAVYGDYYRRMVKQLNRGPTLELGAGSGQLREHLQDVVLTDIQPATWLDAAADAQALPFSAGYFENIVMLDVLHHIENPSQFFAEAARALKPGGRLVMLEPAITPLSGLFYRYLHPEPVDMSQDPFASPTANPERGPYDANQAIPTLLFRRHRAKFEHHFPDFRLHAVRYLSLFAYPLSGGYRRWSLLPASLVRPLLFVEDGLLTLLGPAMAFRLFVLLERR